MPGSENAHEVGHQIRLSVRGEATETVQPDMGVIHLGLTVTAEGKARASAEAGDLLERVLASLSALGGAVRTPGTLAAPLCWTTTSISSRLEVRQDPGAGRPRPTGRTVASVQLEVRVRNFDLLEPLQAALDEHDALELHYVRWQVDSTNPAWPLVRAAAIDEAISRGRDYARALGGQLVRIEHLADVGLLGGDNPAPQAPMLAARTSAFAAPAPAAPLLDPVPQALSAAIEARFIASGVGLEAV